VAQQEKVTPSRTHRLASNSACLECGLSRGIDRTRCNRMQPTLVWTVPTDHLMPCVVDKRSGLRPTLFRGDRIESSPEIGLVGKTAKQSRA
jgi:hypothetical protein